MKIVISQPMYFPWVGMLEQLKVADIFIFYDDVQFVKGSLFNRVKVKTQQGSRWLTVPLKDVHLEQKINEIRFNSGQDWRTRQLSVLRQAYSAAPQFQDMMDLAKSVLLKDSGNLADLSINSMLALADYLSISLGKTLLRSSEIGIGGSGSQRVFDICKSFGATQYITGHGAANYLDHQLFEEGGIEVKYMQYQKAPYAQLHGEFTPFVSSLDLVANIGKAGSDFVLSGCVNWRHFLSITELQGSV